MVVAAVIVISSVVGGQSRQLQSVDSSPSSSSLSSPAIAKRLANELAQILPTEISNPRARRASSNYSHDALGLGCADAGSERSGDPRHPDREGWLGTLRIPAFAQSQLAGVALCGDLYIGQKSPLLSSPLVFNITNRTIQN